MRFPRRTLVLLLVLATGLSSLARAQCDRLPGCELVWSDEFDGNELDLAKWEPMVGNGGAYGVPGWGNNELEYYQAANAKIAGGRLTITARREAVGGFDYTSARLRTLRRGDWTYGRIEMRARLPIGQGLWPAFWMLPSDAIYGPWAASGEIDIMEALGSEPNRVLGTLHYGARWPNNTFSGSDFHLPSPATFHDDFHTFAIEWERHEIRWYVDGELYATQSEWFSTGGPYPAPFDADFHLLLNLAVGGNFPGAPNSSTSFPQELVVDWVRVYQSAYPMGTQTATTALSFDPAVKMKTIRATLTTAFENQALANDDPTQPRSLACAAGAQGEAGGIRTKGQLELWLAGRDGASVWESSRLRARLDRQGEAGFDAESIAELAVEAGGAPIRTLRVLYSGRGGKKVRRVTLDCSQWRSP
jgi:beta-glucanase (GH16 family)